MFSKKEYAAVRYCVSVKKQGKHQQQELLENIIFSARSLPTFTVSAHVCRVWVCVQAGDIGPSVM